MYTTPKNSFTKVSKDIIINKIHHFDDLFSLESIPYTITVELTAMPGEGETTQKEINITHSINYHKINFFMTEIFLKYSVFNDYFIGLIIVFSH